MILFQGVINDNIVLKSHYLIDRYEGNPEWNWK